MKKQIRQNCIDTCGKFPKIIKEYLIHYADIRKPSSLLIQKISRILSAFNRYLVNLDIKIASIKIAHIDKFLTELNTRLTPSTYRLYLFYVRQFVKYLYQERGILKRDLSLLMTSGPRRGQIIPPKFLQNYELQRLFDNVDLCSKRDIRSYAILHLSYEFGLLPKEICMITLDDIRFSEAEINLRSRCYEYQLWLPLSDKSLKAIVFCMVKARPRNNQRALFLKLKSPYEPISPANVCSDISRLMHKVNLPSSSYWLRHTYAKNLLEQGASTFEIKEILGYERMQTAEHYLRIHVKLMRKVLFDETL
jgi:site-specific recombinase XerD